MQIVTLILALVGFLLFAEPALACWSGLSVQGERVSFMGHDAGSHMAEPIEVSPTDAIRWVRHLDRVLPKNVVLTIDAEVTVARGGVVQRFAWDHKSLRGVADLLTEALGIARIPDPPEPQIFTVQVAAGTNRDGANALARTLGCETHSDVERGAFPGCNPLSEVVTKDGVFRVWYGRYLDRESARAAADDLASKTGLRPFVRGV